MTKAEQTLDDKLRKTGILHRDMTYLPGLEAMRQHAMEFAEWAKCKGWEHYHGQEWVRWSLNEQGDRCKEIATTSELYDQFNNQNS